MSALRTSPTRSRTLRRLGPAGFTIAELMTVMVIMGLVFAAIGSLYVRALQDYRDVTMRGSAHIQAARAIRLMQADVRGALSVIQALPDQLTIAMPSVHWDATRGEYVPDVPVQPGEAITYYRGNDGGVPDPQGADLWRARRPMGNSDFTPESHPLATNIEQVSFIYDHLPPPNQSTVRAVTAQVIAADRLGAEHVSRSHTIRMTLRNVVVEH